MTLKLYGSGSIENVDSIVTSASATLSATELGYIDGVTSALQTQLNNAGKILQIVRAIDGTDRSTTSTSFVDASLSVTITPQKSDSAILLIYTGSLQVNGNNDYMVVQITDNSNNGISGAAQAWMGDGASTNKNQYTTVIGYATPATTSATTYKVRFRIVIGGGPAANILNGARTPGQLYAIEVSA